jgi:hypothetical protein
MKLFITESQYIRLKSGGKLLTEEVDLYGYDNSDFIEVFYMFFRKWVIENHGDEIGKYPASFLIKKYFDDFTDDLGISVRWGSSEQKMANVGKELVKQGKHSLTSLRPEVKFTEKHKRALDIFLKTLKLPDFLRVEFNEDSPYHLQFITYIDVPKMFANLEYEYPTREIKKPEFKLRTFIKDVMGIEIGNPVAGQLSLESYTQSVNQDEFDKELRKIRKELKSGFENRISRITFSYDNYVGILKVAFPRYAGYSQRSNIADEMSKRLVKMGYNKNALKMKY